MKNKTRRRIRCIGWILFVIYMLLLVYALFLSEAYGRQNIAVGDYRYNLVPFREIKRYWIHRESLGMFSVLNLAGNIAGFVPFGFILPILGKKRPHGFLVVCAGCLFSLCVECTQLILRVGSCDVDDVILNTLGVLTGYIAFRICNKIRRLLYEKKKEIKIFFC